MTYQEYSLILKALKHYESCCAIEEIMSEAKIRMALLALRGDDEAMISLADTLQNECNAKIETMQEQVTLLKAKLIMERDKALADEAIL